MRKVKASITFLSLMISFMVLSQNAPETSIDSQTANKSKSMGNFVVTIDAGAGSEINIGRGGYFVKSGFGLHYKVSGIYQLGIGFGVRYYNYTKRPRERTRLAFQLDNRVFFTRKKTAPYVRFGGGYGKDLTYKPTSGLFLFGNVGVQNSFKNGTSLFLEVGVDYDDLKVFQELAAVTGTIGIAF